MTCEICGGTGIKQDESKCPCGAEPVTAEEILRVLGQLLECPALDEDFNHPEWGCGETSSAVSAARALYDRLSEEEKQP